MLPDYEWPDPEDRAEDLAPVADEMVRRIRTDNPTRLCKELLNGLDRWEEWGVICLLAARVNPDEPYEVQVGWAKYRDAIQQAALIPIDTEPVRPVDTEEANVVIRRLMAEQAPVDRMVSATGLTVGAVKARMARMRQADREAAGVVAA